MQLVFASRRSVCPCRTWFGAIHVYPCLSMLSMSSVSGLELLALLCLSGGSQRTRFEATMSIACSKRKLWSRHASDGRTRRERRGRRRAVAPRRRPLRHSHIFGHSGPGDMIGAGTYKGREPGRVGGTLPVTSGASCSGRGRLQGAKPSLGRDLSLSASSHARGAPSEGDAPAPRFATAGGELVAIEPLLQGWPESWGARVAWLQRLDVPQGERGQARARRRLAAGGAAAAAGPQPPQCDAIRFHRRGRASAWRCW
jgi:hypothetical protein